MSVSMPVKAVVKDQQYCRLLLYSVAAMIREIQQMLAVFQVVEKSIVNGQNVTFMN